ncbi:hypothetical protein GGX14DRAFT_623340 [Mycena pura]|uniref:Ubiquitin-like protease family profile domain-containing protein n=1 Tax=Mycena pura TaxID=153505 RepID=A0AAD6VGZ0_9AGAR|nr:hypothetical protein GGX14DRAFT_623340 [Mycena pura]
MDDYVVEDEDLQRSNPEWNPLDWIACGRTFRDPPHYVSVEVERARRMPVEIESMLPSPLQSPAGFHMHCSVPVWNPVNDAAKEGDHELADITFDDAEPTFIPASLAETSFKLVRKSTLRRLHKDFGQAFLDGKRSIRDARDSNNIQFYPLWYLSYAERARQDALSWNAWDNAMAWIIAHHENEEPEESVWRERTCTLLASMRGWSGRVGCGLGDLTFERLAEILGDSWLSDAVVDALIRDIEARMKTRDGSSSDMLLADTFFATCISNGAATNSNHPGHSLAARYTHLLTSPSPPHSLLFPLHSPPVHWAGCRIDVRKSHIQFADSLRWKHPKALVEQLLVWLEKKIGLKNIQVTDDLPCGLQEDSFNCGIIAPNALAHAVLGDELWTPHHARTYRYRAFCVIASMIVTYQGDANKTDTDMPFIDLNEPVDAGTQEAVVDVEMKDIGQSVLTFEETDLTALVRSLEGEDAAANAPGPSAPRKRRRGSTSDHEAEDVPAEKRTKRAQPAPPTSSESRRKNVSTKTKPKTKRSEPSTSPISERSPLTPRPNIPYHVQQEIKDSLRNGVPSDSAKHDRVVGILIKSGLFRGNEKRLDKLRRECMASGDPNPGLDINNPKQVICSRCQKPVQLKAIYEAKRFLDHWNKGACKKAPVPAAAGSLSITSFFGAALKTPASTLVVHKPKPTSFEKLCPGLTSIIHPRIGYYIDNCPATGGGAHPINFYVAALFKKRKITSIRDSRLTEEDRKQAYHQKALDNDWRIETSPHRASVVSTHCRVNFTVSSASAVRDDAVVCPECWKLKYTPKIYDNPIQTKLMTKYKGLEELLAERSDFGIYLRFARGVATGLYKDNQVFLGLVQTMQMATERRVRGVGMQNFRYPRESREFGALIRMSSPRTYRTIAQELRMETERSIRSRVSKQPRFPIGIHARSFESVQQYCEDYGYPVGYPLCLSVDDTKLFPAMQPLYDGPAKTWFLIGLPGEIQLEVTTPDELEKLMDMPHSPATKLRLWTVQIPFPGIPPLAFAILPIASKISASELTQYQLRAMTGLAERKLRFISNLADGAAVERSCQEQVANAGTKTVYNIDPPATHPQEPRICVPLYSLAGNMYVNAQDAPHARKTARNNIFSGARGLVLSDFVVHYKQLYDMAMTVSDPTLYERDVIRADRQDDNAAHRVFSAATLQGLTDNVEENMGVIVFLFVIGELVDAYESRTMSHAHRAKVALRAHLFLKTWKLFLQKLGYSIHRHYLPPGAHQQTIAWLRRVPELR